MMFQNDGFNRFRNMIGRQGAAPSNNDYGLGAGSPGVGPAPQGAWPNKWKGGDMFGAPPPQQKPTDIAPVNPPGGPVSTYTPEQGGLGKGPAIMPGPPGGFGQMPGGGPYNPNGKPGTISGAIPDFNPRNYNPVNPPGGYPGSYGPVEPPSGPFGQSGPYNPFGKPGSISGAVPMGNIEGGPGSPVRPDPTPFDGPPPVSQDYGNLGGMGFGPEGGRDVRRPNPDQQVERGPGGWKWGQMMNPNFRF